MEHHYLGLKRFPVSERCEGKVWKIDQYDDAGCRRGRKVGTTYEIELAYSPTGTAIVIPQDDLKDLLEALKRALDYAEKKTTEELSASITPQSPCAHFTE